MPHEPKPGRYCYRHPHPAVTVDVAAFSVRGDELALLLIRRSGPPFRDCWALPGGFVEIDEDLDASAARELREETGISGVYLEQLHTFGRPDRDPRERVISVAYYALVPSNQPPPRAGSDAREVCWMPRHALPPLAFDHTEIIRMAHERLAAKLDYSTIGLQCMPQRFTLGELQRTYEIIQRRSLDKRNFRKRILSYGFLRDTNERVINGRRHPARLYSSRSPGVVEFVR